MSSCVYGYPMQYLYEERVGKFYVRETLHALSKSELFVVAHKDFPAHEKSLCDGHDTFLASL